MLRVAVAWASFDDSLTHMFCCSVLVDDIMLSYNGAYTTKSIFMHAHLCETGSGVDVCCPQFYCYYLRMHKLSIGITVSF